MAEETKKATATKKPKKPSVPKETLSKPKVEIPKEVTNTIVFYKKNSKDISHLSEIWINEATGRWFWKKEDIEKDKTLSKENKKKFINIKL